MRAIIKHTNELVEVEKSETFANSFINVNNPTAIYDASDLFFVADDYEHPAEPTKADMFDAIVKRMADTYRAKNADYGDSFGQSVEEFGYTAALVRMSDKFNRLKNLMRADAQAQVKDESIKDTILDLACYSVMLAIEVEMRENSQE